MEWKYKNYEIRMNSANGTFYCNEAELAGYSSLASIKKEIDRLSKQQIKGTQAYDYKPWGEEKRDTVTITSIDTNEYFRYTSSNGVRNRSKTLYKLNEHNKKLFLELAEIAKQIKDKETKKAELENQLQKLKVEDINGGGKK